MSVHNSSADLTALAERIARDAHAGQFRRDGERPYIVHPEAVASRVETPEEKAVAWLHDVIEDTELEATHLQEAGVPAPVLDAVALLSKRPGLSYEDYLKGVRQNPLARAVKIADMLSNLADDPTEKQIVKYARGLLILHGEK
ncbi:hypothetical protein [Pelagicoccus sp. SDUM812003]|uniref:hypothetical protein n=1 Tax=Pelagicoccus sp. SDUM812003 TaxID=3041267 RepID=UPI00280D200D|nr:hypothetical protein [Pelagicoccus sp. SDUM812003]MDQ8205500.1 hypothetical protein [Pelagicoccus sp. SDUM812003]